MGEERRGSQPAGGGGEPLPAARRQHTHEGGWLGLIIDFLFFFAGLKLRWCWMADEWRRTLTHWDRSSLRLLKGIKHSRKRLPLCSLPGVFKGRRRLEGLMKAFRGGRIACLLPASFQL